MDYKRVIDEIFSQFKGTRFAVRFWDATEQQYGEGSVASFTLVFATEAAARRLFAEGAIGFGESYMDGSIFVEGNLEDYLRLRHQFKQVRRSWRLGLATLHAKLTSPFSRTGQIKQHYDLGNEFFALLLDADTMSYSAALFNGEAISLRDAQKRKLEFVASTLDLSNTSKVLDLGSGWGGFAAYAATTYGVRVEGMTLSKEQLSYSTKHINDLGLSDLVSFSYKDMGRELPTGPYDAVVSLESIEHIGKDGLQRHMQSIHDALGPTGSAYIQCTGRYVPRAVDPWTLKYVFPGGYLPAKQELIDAAEAAGFSIEFFTDDTPDYIATMSYWIENLESNRDVIEGMHGKEFYRLWELWMHGAKVAFEVGSMSLFRIHLKRS